MALVSSTKSNDPLRDAVSQYIDESGKTLMLTFVIGGEKLSMLVSPLPPFDLPVNDVIHSSTLSNVKRFTALGGLEITGQTKAPGQETSIQGVWLSLIGEEYPLSYAYVPFSKPERFLDDVLQRDEVDVPSIGIQGETEFDLFRRNKALSIYLKKYALYTYAKNPTGFSTESFKIDSRHQYDLVSLRKSLFFVNNKVMYASSGRLIVPDKRTRNNLMAYVSTKLLNDTTGVLALYDAENDVPKTIEELYVTVSDFRETENQLVFSSAATLGAWVLSARERDSSKISAVLLPGEKRVYYFASPIVRGGAISMIQNVKDGDFQRALDVAKKWLIDRVNVGYEGVDASSAQDLPSDTSYRIYSETKDEIYHKGKKSLEPRIVEYENGQYAAILFFG